MKEMRMQLEHYHARPSYKPTSSQDFINLFQDIAHAKAMGGKSVNVHLPYEIQHPLLYTDLSRGQEFIAFGETTKRVYEIPLYWENSPEVNYGTWDLKHGQTEWGFVPTNIDLTIDTGHLMLGAVNAQEAVDRIEGIVFDRSKQIKHFHLHENDLVHDDHIQVGYDVTGFFGGKVLTHDMFNRLTQNRTYIFEIGISVPDATKNL